MKVHFIAIGGSAMHNLAMALHTKGFQVTGSDDAIFEPSKSRLEAKGLLPNEMGWFPEKITADLDAIILGMHAHDDNPELAKAKQLGLKIYSYPEYLYEQSKDKTRVVIGGSHGKTTITSMILHVLHYHEIEVDYMVGAQLEGFDCMVKLTEENDFIVLEGDEYLSSTLDRRPKFHLYKPNIALLSGIAWDHINVFPTFENYVEQFRIFVSSITNGGAMIYNIQDEYVKDVVENTDNILKKFPYEIPTHTIDDGVTLLDTQDGLIPLEVFGDHNLSNMEGARLICNQMSVTDEMFYEAIQSFKGASKRLEILIEKPTYKVFKDFAHSPSKVKATTEAVKKQFANRKVIACLELHTYSSLNADFTELYQGALDQADEPIVYYSEEALKIKRMEKLSEDFIKNSFKNDRLNVFTNPEDLKQHLKSIEKEGTVFLMMSSGNYGGIDLMEIFN
ncbi:UDP-N-acetylmuramate--L-alanine ligase [Flavobacteriaceae bacterium UJ101]|nr:UDP-N-acetylmuramate--L-alanine ligase [Flavobacteriaceae bacterium UJ101]